MEIDFNARVRRDAAGGLLVCLLSAVLILGRSVTPVEAGRPQALTPERWQAAALARKAHAEIARLLVDVQTLHTVAAQEPPDAIAAMTLAQRIYAAHRNGTAATAPARQNLITAAETVARYAAGGVERQTALAAVNTALERLRALAPRPPEQPDGHD